MQNLEIYSLPVLADNYIHVIRDHIHNLTIIIDPAESTPVLDFLAAKDWPLTHILITHHHSDHIGGVTALKKETNCTVIGAKIDKHRLPPLDQEVTESDTVRLGSLEFEVLHLPGHTTGHIAYISKSPALAFTGDVIFGMGCGRVFEGTMEEAYTSLQKLCKLDPNTVIYCTHEYTKKNAQFAVQQFPKNEEIWNRQAHTIALRKRGIPTVPLKLADEFSTNPFLFVKDIDEFSRLRRERNNF